MSDLNTRINQSYHLLSELDLNKGLNIATTPGKQEHVPFSNATKTQLNRLKQHLGDNSHEVTPRFIEDRGMAVLNSLELGQEFRAEQAARILTKLADISPLSPSAEFNAQHIARITSKPVQTHAASII